MFDLYKHLDINPTQVSVQHLCKRERCKVDDYFFPLKTKKIVLFQYFNKFLIKYNKPSKKHQ